MELGLNPLHTDSTKCLRMNFVSSVSSCKHWQWPLSTLLSALRSVNRQYQHSGVRRKTAGMAWSYNHLCHIVVLFIKMTIWVRLTDDMSVSWGLLLVDERLRPNPLVYNTSARWRHCSIAWSRSRSSASDSWNKVSFSVDKSSCDDVRPTISVQFADVRHCRRKDIVADVDLVAVISPWPTRRRPRPSSLGYGAVYFVAELWRSVSLETQHLPE